MRGVFISYRRDDTAGYAGRLYDALRASLGRDRVFIDIDSIPAGQDFVEVIEKRIASCSVVIVLIGRAWLKCSDDRGARRLDNPHDFVRLEIASALRLNIPVIPVLVGGARMPGTDDLPAVLAPLAHLNAIEIFDQLFRDSVRHLVKALKPYVHPGLRLWPWTTALPGKLQILGVALGLVVMVGVVGILLSPKHDSDQNGTQQAAPPPSETLAGPDEPTPPMRVRVTTPPDVAGLPPVVEASRNVTLPGSSSQATGPAKPRILWRAKVTVGDSWHVIGIAADGTVYLYDDERSVIDAIRDGKEQWAFAAPAPLGFASDGRLWLGDYQSSYSFNSRGEGGRVTAKNLLPDRAALRLERHQNKYSCSDGKVYASDAKGKHTWAVDLDGNCGIQDPTVLGQTGTIYSASDARTLYAITGDGRVLWTVKQACTKSEVYVFPLPPDDLIVACSGERLYSLREGKPLWTASLGASGGWSWSDPISDRSGNIYVGAEGPSIMTELIVLDRSGKEVWKVFSGTTSKPNPVGFDAQGRFYVSLSEGIVCLSQ